MFLLSFCKYVYTKRMFVAIDIRYNNQRGGGTCLHHLSRQTIRGVSIIVEYQTDIKGNDRG